MLIYYKLATILVHRISVSKIILKNNSFQINCKDDTTLHQFFIKSPQDQTYLKRCCKITSSTTGSSSSSLMIIELIESENQF